MTQKYFTLLLLFFLSLSLEGQDKSFTATADQLAITVVNFRKAMGNGTEEVGTGFFIEKDDELYIVTAAHVAKIMDLKSDVVLQGIDNKPIRLYLFNLAMSINWQYHEKADLAILKLDPSEQIKKEYLQSRFIPYGTLELEKKPIPRNIQLTILGFPLGFGVEEYFSPLTFRTYPSSGLITTQRGDTKTLQTFILLEDPSVGGYSGGPVFDLGIMQTGNITMNTGKTKLYGIVHGTFPDSTGGKMAAITPSFYIQDFFK